MNIHIPVPCHENWNKMLPREKRRHCEVCCKTVVDFTEMQPAEIMEYMQQNISQKICGRFKESQLSQQTNATFYELAYKIIDSNFINHAKKWLSIIALRFIFSQNADAQTKPKVNNETTHPQNKPLVMGKIAVPPKQVKKKPALTKPETKTKTEDCEKPEPRKPLSREEVIIKMGMVRLK